MPADDFSGKRGNDCRESDCGETAGFAMPIIAMIENHRTGLIWKLVMRHPQVRRGLERLGFASPHLTGV